MYESLDDLCMSKFEAKQTGRLFSQHLQDVVRAQRHLEYILLLESTGHHKLFAGLEKFWNICLALPKGRQKYELLGSCERLFAVVAGLWAPIGVPPKFEIFCCCEVNEVSVSQLANLLLSKAYIAQLFGPMFISLVCG